MLDDMPIWIGLMLNIFVTSAPLYIAWLVGLLIAVKRWDQHPRIAMYFCIGTGIFFGASLVFQYVYVMLPRVMMSSFSPSPMQMTLVYSVLGFLHSAMDAGAWVFVLLAVFSERRKPFDFIPKEETHDLGREQYTGPAIQKERPRN